MLTVVELTPKPWAALDGMCSADIRVEAGELAQGLRLRTLVLFVCLFVSLVKSPEGVYKLDT